MANFNIWHKADDLHSDSFCLWFSGMDGTRLTIKNMKFLQEQSGVADSSTSVTYTIFIKERGICHSFQYPKPYMNYQKATFEIKQSGVKGWIVTVDLDTHEVDIQESPYQII